MMGLMHTLADADVAALLRIAGEAGELEQGLQVRRAFILNRLLALIGGCGAACSQIDPRHASDGGWCFPNSITLSGALASHEGLTTRYLTGRLGALDPCIPHLLRRADPGAVVTFRREDVIDRSWYRSEHFNDLRRPLGFGESLYAAVPLPAGGRLKLTLFRELNDPLYTQREVRLVQLFNENLAALYGDPAAAAAAAATAAAGTATVPPPTRPLDGHIVSLPPRLRPVLRQLLAGDSDKQAARNLGLSPHTVHQYAKALYRTFRVNSRSELLARFVVP
jgi:DNA-binding CsgD family transcriptional regulator